MDEIGAKNRIRKVLEILLPVLCALWIGFILGNSLKTGEQSSAQSSTVVETVQQVAQVIAPESKIATATGEDYLELHRSIRKLAHFTEFAVWGALLCGCCFTYTTKEKWCWTPVLGVVVLPIFDELLRKFVSGRASAATDTFIDIAGGIFGFAVAWGVLLLALTVIKRRRICKNKV